MKPVMQTRFGTPDGNCFAACVASILERDLSGVPDLINQPPEENWLEWFNENLEGASVFYHKVTPGNPFMGYIPNEAYFIVCGPCKFGPDHCVVMKAEESPRHHKNTLAHDPHPGVEIEEINAICLVLFEPSHSLKALVAWEKKVLDDVLIMLAGQHYPTPEKGFTGWEDAKSILKRFIREIREKMAHSQAPDYDEILHRIADPGHYLPRGEDYTEPIPSWSARAVMDFFYPRSKYLLSSCTEGECKLCKLPLNRRSPGMTHSGKYQLIKRR